VSGILKLISGSPTKVQAGVDLDGDFSQIGDLPDGIPVTVGRERVDESLAAINAFRAARGLASIDRSLLALDPYRTLDVRLTKSLPNRPRSTPRVANRGVQYHQPRQLRTSIRQRKEPIDAAMTLNDGRIRRRQRLGGLLNYYARAA
jgi:hypothetical protein